MNVIDPRTVSSVKVWCDKMTPYLEIFGYIPRLTDESKWSEWANRVKGIPQISSHNPPDPQAFTDWRQWAMRFNQCLNG